MTEDGYVRGRGWASAAGLCALLLTGCGGGGGGGGSTSPAPPSPFAGSWVQSTAPGPVGSSLVIDSQGTVTGTVTPDPASPQSAQQATGSVAGTISSGGSLSLTAPGTFSAATGHITGLSGPLSIDGRGHLVGTVSEGSVVDCPSGQTCGQYTLNLGSIQVDMTRGN